MAHRFPTNPKAIHRCGIKNAINVTTANRVPNLSAKDRALLGFRSLFLNPRRIVRSAIIIKPSTLLRFHNARRETAHYSTVSE
jgi:hypothetical protein